MSRPTISVIVPVRDGARLLPGCIESIRRVDYPVERIEILVVDNGSVDETPEVARSLGANVVTEPRPGPYAARNHGAAVARGDLLAFTDVDCLVDPGWATAIEDAMGRLDAVCGLSLGAPGGPVARLIQERYEANLRGRANAKPPRPVFDTRNAAVTRAMFQRVGGFDARLDDFSDDLFGIGVAAAGGRLGLCENMVVTHVHPETLRGVWRRQVRHGRAIPQVLALYPPEVTKHFPGIMRHAWLYGKGAGCRMGRFTAAGGTAMSAAVLAGSLRVALRLGFPSVARRIFDLFCRAGTVHGMATSPRWA